MAFYRNPIIEEPPRCIVCSVVVVDGLIVCSATCEDIQDLLREQRTPAMDWEYLGEFVAEMHEPRDEYA